MSTTTRQPMPFERWINRCWRRLRFGQFLKVAADWLAIYLLLLGTAVIAIKLRWPHLWPHALWAIAGVVPVAFMAGWFARRSQFNRDESIAVLDQRIGAGGLLMTLSELPDDQWNEHLPQMEQLWKSSLPQIWPVRFAKQLVVPLAFVSIAAVIPPRVIEAALPANRIDVGQQAAQQVEELLEEIKEAELLHEEEREQITEAVAKLSEETAKSPLTHEKWETVDALRNRLTARVKETAAKLGQLKEAIGAMADSIDGKSLTGMTAEQREQIEKEFFETLRKMSKNGSLPGANSEMKEKLQRLMKSGELPQDQSEREELLNDLKDYLDQEFDKLDDLRSKCKKCEGQDGQCESGQCKDGNCKDGMCPGSKPGQGGVQRGRGDAPLTWGDESRLDGTKFKETILPEGHADKLRDEVIGLTGTSPDVKPADSAPRTTARESTTATGNESWNRTVRPRHRPVLKKYFDEAK